MVGFVYPIYVIVTRVVSFLLRYGHLPSNMTERSVIFPHADS
jgi:hypothetical protein